jgi:serine/threonine-protein kinase
VKRCPSCGFANGNEAGYCIQCGFALANVAADDGGAPGAPQGAARPGYLAAGTVVDGKYRIERVLGEGGMGVVYLAQDVHTDMPVVVKAIRAEFAHDPEFRARTLAEGRALARIDHPNVVRLNAVVVDPSALYLVMQFIDGEPLDAMIERYVTAHARVPIDLALSIFRMVLRGVGAAHAEGLIHRDLKPANILVRKKDGVAKVTDFGIAKGEEDAKAGRGVTKGIIGSVAYMAPEQVRGRRDLDKRVDIYSLGIVLFELLIGRTPFEAPSDFELMRMHTETPMPSARALRSDISAEIDGVIRRACAKERDHRFANTEEFLAAIDAPPPLRTMPLAAAEGAARAAGSSTVPGNVRTEIPDAPAWQPRTEMASGPAWQPQAAPAPAAPPAAPRTARTDVPVAVGSAMHPLPGMTGEGSALPSAPAPAGVPTRSFGFYAALAAGGAVAIGGAAYLVFASGDGDTRDGSAGASRSSAVSGSAGATAGQSATPANSPTPGPTSAVPPGGTPTVPTAAAPPTAPAAPPAEAALAALAGNWRSTSNRDYTAVLTSPDTLEFRIAQASQHPRQGYENGDARFVLRTIAGKSDEFAVEDHLRPTPPANADYAPASRDSCIATWTTVRGKKLSAQTDAKGVLGVDLVQVRTGLDKFKIEGRKVVACNDLGSAPAEPIESRLSRVR